MEKKGSPRKFGYWTAIARNHDETWLCRCRCGNEENIPETWLISGFSVSCGCRKSRAKDLRNKRFGMLTSIEPVKEKNRDGSIRWLCICDCGNQTVVSSNHLLQGHTASCGCRSLSAAREKKTHVGGTCLEILFSPKLRTNNTSGHTGVHQKRSKWVAYINVGKKFYWLGSFDRKEEAIAARKKAEEEWKTLLFEKKSLILRIWRTRRMNDTFFNASPEMLVPTLDVALLDDPVAEPLRKT